MGLSGFTGSESIFITSVQDQNSFLNNSFVLFPNPANNSIHININTSWWQDQAEIIIVDVLGKEVEHFQTALNNFSINSKDLANGLYYLTLKTKNSISSQKLVIQH